MKGIKSVFNKSVIFIVLICLSLLLGGAGNVNSDREVYLGGFPVGIELDASGVVVTDTFEILTDNGVVAPAKKAGILVDDVILSVNGQKVSCAQDVINAVQKSALDDVEVEVQRGKDTITLSVRPAKDSVTKEPRIGVSVTEGISGVGTVTFITKTGNFACLGHEITDMNHREAGDSGSIYKCSIFEVQKGQKGRPGELHGLFHSSCEALGEIVKNTERGVFGKYLGDTEELKAIAVADPSEIKEGDAYIISTLSGDIPRRYEIKIEEVSTKTELKGLIIKVVDKRLLDHSGGIVRGMSGSPIIQNGKLIGAVTHVLVNDPTRGYGILAENMLELTK